MWVYRCLIRGENFTIKLDEDGERLHGFFATRFVRAQDEERARKHVLAQIRSDPQLNGVWKHNDGPQPMVYFEKVERAAKLFAPPGKGYTFFAMDERPR